MTRHQSRRGSAGPEVHVHVRRVVVDQDAQSVGGIEFPAALESALDRRLGPRASSREAGAPPSPAELIADAIAVRITTAGRVDGGGHG